MKYQQLYTEFSKSFIFADDIVLANGLKSFQQLAWLTAIQSFSISIGLLDINKCPQILKDISGAPIPISLHLSSKDSFPKVYQF